MNMTRRNFFIDGAAFGGIVATSALPAFADNPALFPQRGRWERLSIGYQHIDAGAEKPFSILHISDTHLTAAYSHEREWTRKFMERRSKTFGGRQEEALRDSLAWAKQHVDFIVHTGDMVDMVSKANLDLVKKYFGEGGEMMLGCLGNHEYYYGQGKGPEPEEKKKALRDALAGAFPFELSLSSSVLNGVNFVMLDNASGVVSVEQATRFEAEVKKGLPIILCLHCPFATRNIVRAANKYWKRDNLKSVWDANGWKEPRREPVTRDFVAYLKAQPLLKGILAGHYHIDVADRFSPTANEFLVGGNFLFHGQEITIS